MTPDGGGYISCSADGSVTTYGDAAFHGSMAGRGLSRPIVGCAEDPATGGYWLVAADGGVFSFGAPYHGSTGGQRLAQPVVGMTATPSGGGYWLVASDGGVFSFGNAPFEGSAYPAQQTVVGIAASPAGYVIADSTGGMYGYGSNPASNSGPTVTVMTRPHGQPVQLTADGAAYDVGNGNRFPAGVVSGTRGSTLPQPFGAPGSWQMVLDDEFSGSALDTTKWSTGWLGSGVTPPVNSSEKDCYDPAEVAVTGGSLHLTAVGSPCTVRGATYPYRSGMVNSDGKAQFSYGYFEARIFLPGSGGSIYNWPAFWTDGQSWPADGEMDVMEGLSGQACWHFHSPAGGPGGCSGANFTGWHTYGADWEPGSVTYYYDGVPVGRITTGITSAPMYMILNYAVEQPTGGPTSPGTMQVDYVRVWQH